MKISNNLKRNSIYLQKRDILYLNELLSTTIIDRESLEEYKPNDFILIEKGDITKLVESRDEILEFKDFLSMTLKEAEQRMDDAEQLLYIVKRKGNNPSEILRYSYAYSSAINEFIEKGRGTLSFAVPLTFDMLNDYLFYDSDGTYYASSTTMPHTYQIGKIDGEVINLRDNNLEKFIRSEMTTARDLDVNSSNDKAYLTKIRSNDQKKLYYTINRKK